MTINIAPRMARKSKVVDMAGNIIDLLDETSGGYIIRRRQIVNPEKWQEHLQKEQDKRKAAQAMTEAISNPSSVDRNVNPKEESALKVEVEGLKKQLAELLELAKK